MKQVYLFDWGDTLMVDDLSQSGHMKDWPEVAEVPGAASLLAAISQTAAVYVATGAENTNPELVQAAFKRTSLSSYITGYFCPDNVGFAKSSTQYYRTIATMLGVAANEITMVGDNLTRDVLPALEVGMKGVWFNPKQLENTLAVKEIYSLDELIGE
ncbi:HAD family hydrolase [Motilimonas cestriensis]|uniref:HAD family hydrolase n=1 Tax=Motilimonas cestriensis TaxID=2742685 RepID=UPI003DA57550